MVNFFIPKKINVGFQERKDTYTGKLAYVIYFDEKGKLRKETSWNGWRDKKINNIITENEPTSGFVLNKKAGGYSTGWNHRQTYVRVYDPRGFEFEITVPNLLYILENATSTKGKGLEGDFVYGWDGKDLVLIPCDAPDYKELVKLNELRHSEKKIGARDLKIGATYRTRQNNEWIYIGKFDEYDYYKQKSKKPKFWFYTGNGHFETITSPTQKLVEVIDEECVSNYADLFDKMECKSNYSPIDDSKTQFVPYTFEEFNTLLEEGSMYEYIWSDFYGGTMKRHRIYKRNEEITHYVTRIVERKNYWGTHSYEEHMPVKSNSVKEIFDLIKPQHKYKYLENGKFHSEVKY